MATKVNCPFCAAVLRVPETSLGTMVGGGVTYHLAQAVGMVRAKWLIYTGKVLTGTEARDLGLALESVPIGELMPSAMALAGELAAKAPLSMALAKKLIQKAPGWDVETTLLAEAEAILACMGTEDWKEGIAAFSEKRSPTFTGR